MLEMSIEPWSHDVKCETTSDEINEMLCLVQIIISRLYIYPSQVVNAKAGQMSEPEL